MVDPIDQSAGGRTVDRSIDGSAARPIGRLRQRDRSIALSDRPIARSGSTDRHLAAERSTFASGRSTFDQSLDFHPGARHTCAAQERDRELELAPGSGSYHVCAPSPTGLPVTPDGGGARLSLSSAHTHTSTHDTKGHCHTPAGAKRCRPGMGRARSTTIHGTRKHGIMCRSLLR